MTNDKSIDLGEPVLGDEELDRISDVFETGWILNGPETEAFESDVRDYVGAEHAVSVMNCTAGMDLAFKALDVQGGTAILPGQAFIANGIALLQNDVTPRFVDVKEETYNVDPEALKEHAPSADAVLVLHYAGHPAEMDAILDIAEDHDLQVIEDAAHSLGSSYRGRPVGTLGDVTVFSFGPLKMITTAMGGMVTTPHGDVADEFRTLRSYGMDQEAWERDQRQHSWQYSIPRLGHNYRLTDVAAAMGRAQLERIEEFIDHRRTRAAEYTERFSSVAGIHPPVERQDCRHTYLYYVIRVGESYPLTRNELAEQLEDRGAEISVHWDPPLHEHQVFRSLASDVSLPASERLADELLTLPMHPALSSSDIEYVADIIEEFA